MQSVPMFAGTAARLCWAGVAALMVFTPAAVAADGGRMPAIPKGRALAELAAQPSVLLAVRPGLTAERLVAGQGGSLVSSSLRVWRVGGSASGRLVPELARLGLLRYAEPNYVRTLS